MTFVVFLKIRGCCDSAAEKFSRAKAKVFILVICVFCG